ncbi:MAG: hypothetical protein RIQ60_4185 [Pseudomonadota bacterium]|jgi:hypothetical protein
MSISMSSASLPIFSTGLRNLKHCLEKGMASAAQRNFSADVLVNVRLAPDMLPLASQVRIACDAAKLCVARVGGLEAPRHEDNETTMAQLCQRIDSTLAFLDSVPAAALDGSEAKEISFPVGRERVMRVMKGEAYLKHWALPNFFFHITTAYALLRHNGVDLGKVDYLMGAQAQA